MENPSPCKNVIVSLGIALVLPVLYGQDDPGDEPVFELQEFRVEASSMKGYTATNATSGTMLNTALKDTPFAIDVVTPQFIEDTGSTDLREVLAYDSGVMLENTMERSDGNNFTTGVENDDRSINNTDTDVVIRGFRAPTLKNGFFTLTRVDSINIGRFERASGPTSLLYGVGAISGITNVITKTPSDLNRRFGRTEVFAGNNSFYRATLDYTDFLLNSEERPVMYRVNAAWQTEEEETPYLKEDVFFVSPVLEFKPFRKTNVLLEVEYGTRETTGIGTKDIADNLFLRVNEENESAQLLRDKILDRHFVNLSGPDATREDTVVSPRIEITQEIGKNLFILASANKTRLDRDTRTTIELQHVATGFPDAFYSYEASVQDYVDNSYVEYGWADTVEEYDDEQVRISALYTFELFGGVQNIVAGRQERSLVTDTPSQGGNWVGGSDLLEIGIDELPIRYNGEETFSNATRRLDNQWYQGHYLIFQGSFWDKRITPVIGYRWDRTQTRSRKYDRTSPDEPWIRDPDFLADRGAVDGYDRAITQTTPTYGLSVAITDNFSAYAVYAEGIALSNTIQRDGNGVSFEPPLTENKEAGLKFELWDGKISGRLTYFELLKYGGVRYSFYASNPGRGNFDPTQPVIYELTDRQKNAFEAWSGIDLEADYGIEKTRSSDGPALKWPVPYDLVGEELTAFALYLWDFYGGDYSQWQPNNGDGPYFSSGNNPSEDRGAYHNFDEESTGWEFRLNFNPVENWQNVVSYTYNEVVITAGLSNLAGGDYDYYGIHPVFYYTGGPDNFSEDFRPESYTGDLGAGTVNNDTPQHTFRYWSKYSFTDGFLEGFEVAVGYRYQGERIAESPWLGARDSIQRGAGEDNVKAPVPAFDLWDLALTYSWDMWNMDWSANLNIRNIFDREYVEAKAANLKAVLEDGTEVPAITRFYLPEQRSIRFTLRAAF
jgi:iron complex outermembrane receptor protein